MNLRLLELVQYANQSIDPNGHLGPFIMNYKNLDSYDATLFTCRISSLVLFKSILRGVNKS